MSELQIRLPDFRPHNMLDFGAGPGTAIWAASAVWSPALPSLEISHKLSMLNFKFKILNFKFDSDDSGTRVNESEPFTATHSRPKRHPYYQYDMNALVKAY